MSAREPRPTTASSDSRTAAPPARSRRFADQQQTAWAVLLVGIFLGPAVAVFLPDQPLDLWPWTRGFTDFMASWVPSIDTLTKLSTMPQLTRFFMSLAWSVWALLFLGLFLRYGKPDEASARRALAMGPWWFGIVMPIFMAALFWEFFNLPRGAFPSGSAPFDWAVTAMGRSRFWLGCFGATAPLMAAFAIVATLRTITIVRLAYRIAKETQ